MNWILKIIPAAFWKYLGIGVLLIGSIYYVDQQGYKRGKLNTELALSKAGKVELESQIEQTNIKFQGYLEKLDRDSGYQEVLKEYLQKIGVENKQNMRLLEDALKSTDASCSILNEQYYRLFQSLYNKKPE